MLSMYPSTSPVVRVIRHSVSETLTMSTPGRTFARVPAGVMVSGRCALRSMVLKSASEVQPADLGKRTEG